MGDLNRSLFASGQMGAAAPQQNPDKPVTAAAAVGVAVGVNLTDAKGTSNFDTKGIGFGTPEEGSRAIVSWSSRPDSQKANWVQRLMQQAQQQLSSMNKEGNSSAGSGGGGGGGGGSSTATASSSSGATSGGAASSSGSSAPVSSGGGGSTGGSNFRGGSEDAGLSAAIASARNVMDAQPIQISPAVHIAESTPEPPAHTPVAAPSQDGPMVG